VDVHRATDAVLLGIDEIAKKLPSVLFVTTTNFIEAVDEAFLSRADLVMRFQLPDATRSCASSRARSRSSRCSSPRWRRSRATGAPRPSSLSNATAGMAAACGNLCSPRWPNAWRWRAIREAHPRGPPLRRAKKGGVEWIGGAAPTSREMFPDVPKDLMHDHDHGHRTHAIPPA
jgi:hypothetical protein